MNRFSNAPSANLRNYFRNQVALRFRWRHLSAEEFDQWSRIFDSTGKLPDPVVAAAPSLDELTSHLRQLAVANNRVHALVEQLLVNLEQGGGLQDQTWNNSYLLHPSPVDISGGGCSFPLSHQTLPVGTCLEMAFYPATDTLALRCVVRVVRTYTEDAFHWICCRFEMIASRDRDKIISLQMAVQRDHLKKLVEDKLQVLQTAPSAPPPEPTPPPEIVETPEGHIANRRKLVRVDDSVPIVLRPLSREEADSSIAIFKKYGIFPNFWEATIFDETKMGEFERSLQHLRQYSPPLRDAFLELWEILDHLFSQVSPAKKQNVFIPVILQLIVSVHRMSGLSRISSMNTDVVKNLTRCVNLLFSRDAVGNFRQVLKQLRLEFAEVLKKFKVLYRIDAMQRDILYPLFEKMLMLVEAVGQQGVRSIFGHQLQPVNLSGNGLAYTHYETMSKGQMVSLMIGIPEAPWRWISCIGQVVLVKPSKNNVKLVKDGQIFSQLHTAIQFEYIHPSEQERLVAYVHSRLLDLKNKKG